MSYRKGEAFIGLDDENYTGTPREAIQLPHSCDEWVIGGIQEAQDLIDDLKELQKKLAQTKSGGKDNE